MRKNNPYRKEARRKVANENHEKRKQITDKQQLEKLDRMFGTGLGATKERNRLQKRIENTKRPVEVKVEKAAKANKKAEKAK
jgi:hypothetical protein